MQINNCPKCGSEEVTMTYSYEIYNDSSCIYIKCDSCHHKINGIFKEKLINEWNKKMEDNGKESYIKVLEDFIQKLRSDEVTDFEIESSNPPKMMFSHEHRDFIRVPSENHSIDIRYTLKKKEPKKMYKCPVCNTPLNESMFCIKCCSKWTKSEPGKEESNEDFMAWAITQDKIEESEIEWSDIDSITDMPKSSKQLADEHWGYIEGLLEAHGEDEELIEQIGFHYKSAFIHGYKHAMEDINKS